nr:phospholipase D-like domain-containing protein [uncultured Duganella sp.]
MADPIKRRETTHIDEVCRTATSTVQWFAEMRNRKGHATHPITHNNQLTMFICGEEGFADIARQIKLAQKSIDICCWGFDPGMELVRGDGGTWPRGETYGDLLIAAGKRGVKVRLLVWYDAIAVASPANPLNMPGYSHGLYPWCVTTNINAKYASQISARHSLAMVVAERKKPTSLYRKFAGDQYIEPRVYTAGEDDVPLLAREEYCYTWYKAAFKNRFENVEVRVRDCDAGATNTSLAEHAKTTKSVEPKTIEFGILKNFGSHHQKPIVIDYAHNGGAKAVGYIMGLNSITDYWDRLPHRVDDPKRERCVKDGFDTLKPYQDYACRLDGGGALIAVHKNFISAWHKAGNNGKSLERALALAAAINAEDTVPAALTRPASPGDCSVQVIRTQPEDQDTSIRDVYFQATDIATMAAGYMYIENQYFQYEDWSRRLLESRRKVAERWSLGCKKAGKDAESMPVMHIFVVVPLPEKKQMVPRTYDALAVLGQQGTMTGQEKMIKDANERAESQQYDAMGNPIPGRGALAEVVAYANAIEKPTALTLETEFGLKVSVAMLNACDSVGGKFRYREIYIHSKLMLIDDTFMTVGSANLNLRSMAVDSEINLATVNPQLVRELRKRIWGSLTAGQIDGGDGGRKDIKLAYEKWNKHMSKNQEAKKVRQRMDGLLFPLKDARSSTMRIG